MKDQLVWEAVVDGVLLDGTERNLVFEGHLALVINEVHMLLASFQEA